jgi:membrane associated rhomboid family serine protease
MTGDTQPQERPATPELRLRPPPAVAVLLLRLIAIYAVSLAGILLSLPSAVVFSAFALRYFALRLAVVLAVLGARVAWVRWAGGPPPIRFGDDAMTLPRFGSGRLVALVPYADIRSVTLAGRGSWSRLILDTPWRAHVFRLSQVEAPDPLEAMRALLRPRILALPEGAAQWDSMQRRQALAERVAGLIPWLTWAIAALLVMAYAVQILAGNGDTMRAIDLGADAPWLVGTGEWWRLVTANLLHLNANHLLGNLLVLLLAGPLLERLVGPWHFVLLVLATGLISLAASTFSQPLLRHFIIAMGFSGALSGVLGALAVLSWRFGAQLPGGLRVRWWVWVLLALSVTSALFVPQSAVNVPRVDNVAHAAGFLAGGMLAWLIFMNRSDVSCLREIRLPAQVALASLAVIWVVAAANAGIHGASITARRADRVALMRAALKHPGYGAAIENDLAWEIATDPTASAEVLQEAKRLAGRAVAELRLLPRGRAGSFLTGTLDTQAVLNYRLGEYQAAIAIMAPLARRAAPMLGSHLAWFLESAVRARAATLPSGSGVSRTALRLDQGTLVFTADGKVPHAADLLALLHRKGQLVGVLQLFVPEGLSGSQILPLPVTAYRAPSMDPPDSMWLDGTTDIEIVWLRNVDAQAEQLTMSPNFAKYDPKDAPLP